MSRFLVRNADEGDNDALCRLAELPLQGQISLALARRPDFFTGARVQNEAVEISVVCDSSSQNRVVASCATGRRRAFLQGEPCWIRYLSDVRIDPAYAGGRVLKIINDHMIRQEQSQPSSAMEAIMFSDNDAILRVIRRRPPQALSRMRYLRFRDSRTYRTSAIALTGHDHRHGCRYDVHRATPDDIPAIQSFFDREAATKAFYPVYRFDRLGDAYYQGLTIDDYFLALDDSRIVGITGIWDQHSFKQTRIAGYHGPLRWSRPVVNVISRLATGFSLPPAGVALRYFHLHTIATRDNSPDVFRDLLEHIHTTFRGTEYLYFLCGLFTNDPLIGAIDLFRARRDVTAQHYVVDVDGRADPPAPGNLMYVEAARI